MLDFNTEAVSEPSMAKPDPVEGATSMDEPGTIMIETRYGTYEVERDKIVSFPKGVIGFAQLLDYAILNMPHEGTERFKLLQSVDEPGIGFYVVPVGLENGAFDHEEDVSRSPRLCRDGTHIGVDAVDLLHLHLIVASGDRHERHQPETSPKHQTSRSLTSSALF